MTLLFGRLMEEAIQLNNNPDVDVYLCMQGNTGCVNLTVEENKTVAYQNKVFIQDEDGISKMYQDVLKMEEVKENGTTKVL